MAVRGLMHITTKEDISNYIHFQVIVFIYFYFSVISMRVTLLCNNFHRNLLMHYQICSWFNFLKRTK